MPRKKTFVCDVCGEAGAKLRRITRSYGSGAHLLVIENVPVISCPHCGESYLTADTLHELERLKAQRRSVASKRSVPVLAFAS
jgi:YgiT-type zinc finger domain-containing protein